LPRNHSPELADKFPANMPMTKPVNKLNQPFNNAIHSVKPTVAFFAATTIIAKMKTRKL